MKLLIGEQPAFVQAAIWTLTIIGAISFVSFIAAIALILLNTGSMRSKPEERMLPYGIRAARANARASSFLVLEEYAGLRKFALLAVIGLFGSLGGLFLITAAFGT